MGDFESAALRSAANRWLLAGVGSNDETAAGNAMVALARAAADEIDRLRAELVAANQQAADASGWLVGLRYECNELRRAVVAWEAIAPGECFETEEEGDVFHAVHKVLAAVDGGAQ
jgi:ribosomal protein L18